KLTGSVVIGLAGIAGGQKKSGTEDIPQVPVLGYRARLDLNTSFTGEDLLYTRLATGNFPEFNEVADTNQANLAFAQPDDSVLALEVLNYNFPIAKNIHVWLEATGGAFDDFTNTINVLDGDGAEGALSVFGTRNLVYYQGFGSGLGIEGKTDTFDWGKFSWSVGYLAPEASNPKASRGLFNGPYAILAQLQYTTPDDKFDIAFTFNNGYKTIDAGSNTVQLTPILGVQDYLIGTSHNTYALTTSWQITDNFILGAWGGMSKASTLNSFQLDNGDTLSRGKLTFWYWAISLAFPNAFAEGNMAGLILGMQPWATENTILVN
ncbi:MAG: iron uptake porin, partial [Snowella sp.]